MGDITRSAFQGINTASDKVKYSETGTPILQSKHITSGKISFEDIRYIDKEQYSNYFPRYVPLTNDILFANIGTIGPSTVVTDENEFLVAWNILKITLSNPKMAKFVQLQLEKLNQKHYFELVLTGNATKFVNKDEMLRTPILVPSIEEQESIGMLFSNLQNTIALHQRKLEQLKQLKQGFLQVLFANDTNVPKVRFAGFTEEWEQRKLGSLVEFYSGLTYSPDNITNENGTFVLRSSNVKGGEIVNADNVYVDSAVVNSDNVKVGDIIVVVRNGSRELIGKHAQIKDNMNDTVIGAFMTGIRCQESNFTNSLLDTKQFKMEINKNLGATINQITIGSFKKMIFCVTINKKEQLKIGAFFKQLDDTLTLHQNKISQLKKLKKAFLQKMFI